MQLYVFFFFWYCAVFFFACLIWTERILFSKFEILTFTDRHFFVAQKYMEKIKLNNCQFQLIQFNLALRLCAICWTIACTYFLELRGNDKFCISLMYDFCYFIEIFSVYYLFAHIFVCYVYVYNLSVSYGRKTGA